MKKIFILIFAAIIAQSCSMSKDDSGTVETGEGGSLARFTIVGDYLYVVNESSLQTYSLASDPQQPVQVDNDELGFGIETIFPYGDHLLMGTTTGMYICDISRPSDPSKITSFQHVRSCDPVVAENGYAYVTLNTSNQQCWTGQNELQIVDIQDITNPYLVKSYSMSAPKGLDVHNDSLFVCDQGLKVLDVSTKNAPVQLAYFSDVAPEDVIYTQGRLLLIGSDGFTQYSIRPDGIHKLSTLPVTH